MKKFLLLIPIFVFAFCHIALAYEPSPTHRDLTSKIVEIYNKYYSPKITDEQADWFRKGTIEEDTAPRWINHFYDPIYKTGWSGEHEGDIPADTVQKLVKIFLSPQDALPAVDWIHNQNIQNKYGLYQGNQTYDRALEAYGYASLPDGMKGSGLEDLTFQNSYIALGHTLHLLEDMGVPAHVRNDTHADVPGAGDGGEPYEKWAGQPGNDDLSFLDNLNPEKESFSCAKIDDCLIGLALYTNENFYSDDTIDATNYTILNNIDIESIDDKEIYFRKDGFNNYYPFKIHLKSKNTFTVADPIIHRAYWQLLSKQIVLAGVQALKIFNQDAQTAKENAQYPVSLVQYKTPSVSFISPFGVASSAFNWLSSAWGNVTNSVNNIFASAIDVVSSAFSGNNLKPAGEVSINQAPGGQDSSLPETANNASQPQPVSADIAITEIMYNPKGSDSGREWVEIFNNDDAKADLTGWKFFESNTNHNLKLARGSNTLNAFEYAVITGNAGKFLADYPNYQGTIFESPFSLNNSGETVAIKSGGEEIDSVNYQPSIGADGDGNSLQLINGSWQEGIPTPGKMNVKAGKVSGVQSLINPDNLISQTDTDASGLKQDNNSASTQADPSDSAAGKGDILAQTPTCDFSAIQSPSHAGIIINEIAWMGSADSASNEWIELKNVSNGEINLSNWQLQNKNGSIKINLSNLKTKTIKPGAFLLLERTDDNSVKNISASLIYSGAISNSNETLKLFDDKCNLADEAAANPQWPAGDNEAKKTMERNFGNFGWHTSSDPGGTPKKENSSGIVYGSGGNSINDSRQFSSSDTSADTQNNSQSTPQFYPVVINEIMYNPQGDDSGNEWLEVFNNSTSTIDLTDWKIFEGGANHGLTLKQGDKNLNPGSYAVISNGGDTAALISDYPDFSGTIFESPFSLNNTGETIMLKNQDLKIDEVAYQNSWGADGNGKSLQLFPELAEANKWKEAKPTPGVKNELDLVETDISATTTDSTSTNETNTPDPNAGKILISEIMAGAGAGRADEEFVELYNLSSAPIDLTGFSLKRKSSVAATSTQVLASSEVFKNKIIPANGFFLVGSQEYQGDVVSDARYSSQSYHLAYDDDAVILYSGSEAIDEADYSSVMEGQSIERKAFENNSCVSAQDSGEYSGNNCDTDNSFDFENRISPRPQNSQSFPEPRQKPTQPENFSLSYSTSTNKIIFEWQPSADYSGSGNGIIYVIKDASASGNLLPDIRTPYLSSETSISELGKTYKFSLTACDKDGLCSEAAEKEIAFDPIPAPGETVLAQNVMDGKSTEAWTIDYFQWMGVEATTTFKSLEIYGESDLNQRWLAGFCKVSDFSMAQCFFDPNFAQAYSNETFSVPNEKTLLTFSFPSPITLVPGVQYRLFIKTLFSAAFPKTSIYGSINDTYINGFVNSIEQWQGYGGHDNNNIGISDIYFVLKN